ncbi:patatin-like phospholipase family protein [Paludicola sp. MB14-C6]|uniref:patatin-like phospholipase family protein n=1 Tax=Paludihabitans sp. MB14-C6 TaxID=3070656 RepID=UPI0027DAD92E|nr:patatin-like phospholipase family protein [Paludicola sp. MB14-C6]WMJ22806.1 patatin-like phospholipase family protein [Paludicola sp. MB14-C6]
MSKTALVLGGGGSRGSFQIGVWQALNELDINIDIVTGTSVGALNAALIAMNDYDNAFNLWKQIKTSMVLAVDIDESLSTQKQTKAMIRQFISDYAKQGGTDAYPLKELLNQYVNEEIIRNSPIECGFIMVDKKSLKPKQLYKEDIKEGQMADYLLASSSLFPAIKSCNIEGIEYIDGGYYDNLPVELALNKGAEHVIAVDLEAIGMVRKQAIAKAENLTMIRSYWNLGPILVFDNKTNVRNIRLGYLDTMKAFHVFDGVAYTFIKNQIPAMTKKRKELIHQLNDILQLTFTNNNHTGKEELFHLKIQTHLTNKYGKEMNGRHTTFIRACMEEAAELFELDYLKIYSVDIFEQKLNEMINKVEVPYYNEQDMKKPRKYNAALALLDKKARTVYLAIMMKKAMYEHKKLDALALAFFVTDEFLAAYYIALMD